MSTVTSSTPTPITAPGTGDFLSLTDAAVAKVKFFAGSMPDSEGKPLRIFVQGGGCSGFQYGQISCGVMHGRMTSPVG